MAGQPVTCPFCRHPVLTPHGPADQPPNPLSLEDPIDEAEQERRTLAHRAERDKKLKRKALIYIVCGWLFAIIATVVLVVLWPQLMTDARGAKDFTGDDLATVKESDAEESPWIAYTAERVIETDLGLNQPKGKHTNEATRYVLVRVQDKWLIAERPIEEKGNRLEGKLEVWGGGTSKEAADRIKVRYPELKDQFLPVQLSASRSGTSATATIQLIALGAFVVISLGCALYGLASLPRERPEM